VATPSRPATPATATYAARSTRLRIRGGLALAVAAIAVVLVPGGIARHAVPPPGVWVLTTNSATVVAHADPDTARHFFATPDADVLGGWPGATTAMSWASYASFATAVAHGWIPASVHTVMYDPEGWADTPLAEQRDPARAMRAFATLAHSRSYTVILTPHPNLTTVPGSTCLHQPGESLAAAYLRCGLPAEAARVSDVLDVQAQFLQADAPVYASVVTAATRQARAVNPNVVVVAHLSTNFSFNASSMTAAWRSVQGVVDGTYLGIPEGVRAVVAVRFLETIRADG
jgi:hypothetical protein